MHTDLHETTDSDFTEFVPAKAARDGHRLSNDPMPASIKPMECPGAKHGVEIMNKARPDDKDYSFDAIREVLGDHPTTAIEVLKKYSAGSDSITKEKFIDYFCEAHLPTIQPEGLAAANNDVIPDGFYLVGNSENPQDAWSKAIIDKVRGITHITKSDDKDEIIGVKIS